MNSHVQVPKFLIRNFCLGECDEETVYVYDFRSGTVHLEDPKYIGTVENYYDQVTEMYLSNRYETPFYKISYQLITWAKEGAKGEPPISPEQWREIKLFIMELRYRSPFIRLKLLERYGHDASFDPSVLVKGHDTDKNLLRFFPDHVLVVATNETSVSFVSSVRGYAQFFPYGGMSEKNWWCPISPKVAVACVEWETYCRYFKHRKHFVFDEVEEVERFNELMLHQYRTEYQKVVRLKGFKNYHGCLFSDDFYELKELMALDKERLEYDKRKAEKGNNDS